MVSAQGFSDLVAGTDTAMAVVTTVSAGGGNGERAGCLVGFHTQCSIDPPRYAVWLSKANHTYRVGLHAEHFAVHFLAEEDGELARLFGTESGDDTDKFAGCEWAPGAGGVPLLRGAPHRFEATRLTLLDDGGDHVCVVLAPTEAGTPAPFRPLRLSRVSDLPPGHEAEERPEPATERAG